jgi:putative ABC transport system permease protein
MANNDFWVSNNYYTYFVAKNGISPELLQGKLGELVIKYVGPQIKQILGISLDEFRSSGNDYGFRLEPLKDIHLKGAPQYNLEPMGSVTTVYIFAVIAVLILVIAIINYVNLATARSVSRAREVGVRKVSGSGRTGLVAQFLGESVIITLISAIIAFLLLLAFLPLLSRLTGAALSITTLLSPAGLSAMAGLVLFTGVAAGFYPAFVLASFDPVAVLKGTLNPGSMSRKLRALLVVFQFTVSIVIIIGSIVVYSQLKMMTGKDLGFDKENLIIVRRPDAFFSRMNAFRDQVLKVPGVEAAGFSRAVPGTVYNNNAFFKDNDPAKNTYLLNQTQVSFDFPQTLGVRLAAGRFFSREYGSDSSAVLINEAAARSLGFTDPVGEYVLQPTGPQQFAKLKIIGVMKDFNIESMHKAISPVIFTVLYSGGGDQYASIRLNGKDMNGTIREIEKIWEGFTTLQPFQYDFFADRWNHLYEAETKTGHIFIIFSVLAVFIACLGLLGLITYITNRRTREIGIRKTYGASAGTVLGILSSEVGYLILAASLIAYPLAWFGAAYWLQGFAVKVPVNPLIFVVATIITLIIGWASISYHTVRAANLNPARALRTD